MKSIHFITLCMALALLFGCADSDNPSGIEKFKKGNETKDLQPVNSSDEFLESIEKVGSEIKILIASLESVKEQIKYLEIQRDSVQNALKQIDTSVDQVKAKKIDPGIKDVNNKLDELKSLKEKIAELQDLREKEVLLADKKKQLFEEEKVVYAEQHQSLWEKGAPPEDFKVVDSLLANINEQINEQTNRLKLLKRKIADSGDQIASIDEQRTSLGIKIRNNYTAQEIFEEFSIEEKKRLEKQLVAIDEQLQLVFTEQKDLNTQLARYKGDETYLQMKHSATKGQERAEQAKIERETLAKQEMETLKDQRNQRMTNALFAICIVALVLFLLYYIGKRKKSAKIKNLQNE